MARIIVSELPSVFTWPSSKSRSVKVEPELVNETTLEQTDPTPRGNSKMFRVLEIPSLRYLKLRNFGLVQGVWKRFEGKRRPGLPGGAI